MGLRVRDMTVLKPEAAIIKKSAQGSVAFLLANTARREHRNAELHLQTFPRKDKSTLLGATTAPPWPQQGGKRWVTLPRGQGAA
jgi:hypothetical protein